MAYPVALSMLPRVSYMRHLALPEKFQRVQVVALCFDHGPELIKSDSDSSTGIFSKAKKYISMSSSQETLKSKLKRYGLAGILSYGIFNTVYYLGTFLFVWLYVAPSPGRLGLSAAAQRLLKVFAMVWAGSQVTKLLRAAAALALAPVVDKFLNWFTLKFNFHSREKAFGFVVGLCFCLALLLFAVLTSLWA